ncbi:MAG: efflux RND transporter periplasmic adaptor subunit [Desulfobacterales bacterium]|jgi:multidrug resistance efflux pump|nr:efflux RND transporter periplasmic adaptor subunit [Desulfobacterales bacterium]
MKIRFQSAKSSAPDRERGIRVPYAPAKRALARWRWYLIVLLVSLPLLYLLVQLLSTVLFVSAVGLIRLERVPINARMAGTVERLEAHASMRVAPGQLLAVLHSPDLAQRDRLLQAELAARLAPADPVRAAGGIELETNVRLARKVVDHQARHLENVRLLFDRGAATVAELNLAHAQMNQAEIGLNQARAALAAWQIQQLQRPASEREEETRIAVLRAEREAVSAQQERLTHTSPVAGIVLEVFAQPGQAVGPGDPLLVLGDSASVFVSAFLDPKHTRYARAGQAAVVRFEDGRRISAVVREKPEITARIPAAVTPALGGRELMLLLTLDLAEPLPPADRVDNLPVKVSFPFTF